MRSRWNLWGSGLSLSLALSILTLSPAALAQTNNDAAAATPPADAAPSSDAPAAPNASASANAGASTDAGGATAPGAEQVEPAEEPAVAPAGAPEPAKVAAAKDEGVAISVKILPGSGYPAPRIRGIKGGSLWLTIPGYQWPYLPKVEGESGLQLTLSGSAWVDTSYANFTSGRAESSDKSAKRWTNQGRGVLRATPVYSTAQGWFVQGNAELVANSDQTFNGSTLDAVDDLYVRAGKWNVFDVTVGRFQGWELYHYGMGLDFNTFERLGASSTQARPPQIYGLDFFWDRPNGGGGNYAAHIYFTDYLRGELLGQIGTRSGQNVYATRGVGIFDIGYLKVKAGFEKGLARPQPEGEKAKTDWNGMGAAVQFVVDPYIEGGVNAAIGYVDNVNVKGQPDEDSSSTRKSVGGFLNGRPIGDLLVGVGYNWTQSHSMARNAVEGSPNYGKTNLNTHTQAFFAIQYSFWDRLFFKFVGARASYDFEDYLQNPPHPFTNSMYSGRFRVMYLF